MKTNDGSNIPGKNFQRGAVDKGALNPGDTLDNSSGLKPDRAGSVGKIEGMQSYKKAENGLDDAGFDAEGSCFYKFGTPYGEKALFNALPPGTDISNQDMVLINEMPLKTVTGMTYPGDGAFPYRDVPE